MIHFIVKMYEKWLKYISHKYIVFTLINGFAMSSKQHNLSNNRYKYFNEMSAFKNYKTLVLGECFVELLHQQPSNPRKYIIYLKYNRFPNTTQSLVQKFICFLYVNLNKLLNTRSSYPCFETKTRRSCDVTVIWTVTIKWHEIYKIECLECSYRFENLYANEQAHSIYGLLGTAI